MSSKQRALWSQIPQTAEDPKIIKWLRKSVITGFFSFKCLPSPDEHFLQQVDSLDECKRIRFFAALEDAKEKYSAASDLFGVVGLPVFVGILALMFGSDSPWEALIFYFAVIVLYIVLYCYYRMMLSVLRSCISVARLKALTKETT